ncbi:hypothetical protein J3Q64DRAFT_1761484 [Phycomyces blakesleeanus]|uniref:Transmembrane protein n=1 Tax=Phycomyces blakesleeanus TaxID=4837 RepID=A0ABR3ASV0_PHYBL
MRVWKRQKERKREYVCKHNESPVSFRKTLFLLPLLFFFFPSFRPSVCLATCLATCLAGWLAAFGLLSSSILIF